MLERRKHQPEKHEPYYPAHALQAAVVMLVVAIVLVLLAVFLHPSHESVARPADASYIPRPEWYFLFLMEILKIFPGELEFLGATVLPALAILVLLLLPFFDRSRTIKLLKRPLAFGIGLFIIIAIVLLTLKGIVGTPPSITSRSAFIELGESVYHEQDCSNCHTINGAGSPIGPELAGLAESRTLSWIHKYLEDPLLMKPDSAMPGYLGALTHEEIEGISVYLISLEKTSAPTGMTPTPEKPPPSPPKVPHTLEGRSSCLACHQTGVGEATKIPTDHNQRSNDVCLSCHQAK